LAGGEYYRTERDDPAYPAPPKQPSHTAACGVAPATFTGRFNANKLDVFGNPASCILGLPLVSTRSFSMSLEEHASVCTFDCPDTCSLTVTVDDGRIIKVRGSEAMPFTDGVICSKVAREMTAFVHGPQRLLHPLRRLGPKGSGRFERISWRNRAR
jgi:anaerobic selenocysteine-containing dehydrogenase